MAVKLRTNPIGKSAASCTVSTSYDSGYHLGTRGLTRSQTGRKNHITCLKPQKNEVAAGKTIRFDSRELVSNPQDNFFSNVLSWVLITGG